jgi:hypothetical protein
MSKSKKADAKRQTVASVAGEVAELRAGLGEVLSRLNGGEGATAPAHEAAEPQVTDLRQRIRGRSRRADVEEPRGEAGRGEGPSAAISAAAERAREQLREEFRGLRAGIQELLEEEGR